MRLKFNKEIEFFFKKYLLPKSFLLKKRIERSIKNADENEIKLIKDLIKPGTDSIDVGVYRGVYSYEMSKYSKTVHSFEPNPVIFDDIDKNLKKIIKNMVLYNFALSNENKTFILRVPIRNNKINKKNYEEYYEMGRATIHEKNIMSNCENFKINSKKIDDLNLNNEISFIKIDVEGHELEVIDGAKKTIEKNKPKLLVEIEEKHTQKKVSDSIKYINSLGYNSFFLKNDVLKDTSKIEDYDLNNNYIFIPKKNL